MLKKYWKMDKNTRRVGEISQYEKVGTMSLQYVYDRICEDISCTDQVDQLTPLTFL